MKVLQNDVGFKDIGIQFAIEQYKKRDINLRKWQIEKLWKFPNMLLYDPYPNFKQHKIFVLNNKMMKKINEKQKNVARKYSSVFKELFLNRIQKFFGVYDTEEVQQNIWITKIHYQYVNKCVIYNEDKITQIVNNKKLQFFKDRLEEPKFDELKIMYNGKAVEKWKNINVRSTIAHKHMRSTLDNDLDLEDSKVRRSFKESTNV